MRTGPGTRSAAAREASTRRPERGQAGEDSPGSCEQTARRVGPAHAGPCRASPSYLVPSQPSLQEGGWTHSVWEGAGPQGPGGFTHLQTGGRLAVLRLHQSYSRAGFWSTSQIPSEEQLLYSPASFSDVCFKTKDKRQFISNRVLCWESLLLSLLFKAALKGSNGPATRSRLWSKIK